MQISDYAIHCISEYSVIKETNRIQRRKFQKIWKKLYINKAANIKRNVIREKQLTKTELAQKEEKC